jgi:shikimate kinase
MNIYLIGYRCTGKTTVGHALAEKYHRPFIDADAAIVGQYHMSITEMVKRYGWSCFREREKGIIEQLCRQPGRVVATGGGVILDPCNVSQMRDTGTVVWLRAGMETIRNRMAADAATDGQRPVLTEKGLMAEIAQTLNERYPLYLAAAHFSVDTDHRTIDAICGEIIKKLTDENLK